MDSGKSFHSPWNDSQVTLGPYFHWLYFSKFVSFLVILIFLVSFFSYWVCYFVCILPNSWSCPCLFHKKAQGLINLYLILGYTTLSYLYSKESTAGMCQADLYTVDNLFHYEAAKIVFWFMWPFDDLSQVDDGIYSLLDKRWQRIKFF